MSIRTSMRMGADVTNPDTSCMPASACCARRLVQPAWPYKRPFYQATLSKHEIQVSRVLQLRVGIPRDSGLGAALSTPRKPCSRFVAAQVTHTRDIGIPTWLETWLTDLRSSLATAGPYRRT